MRVGGEDSRKGIWIKGPDPGLGLSDPDQSAIPGVRAAECREEGNLASTGSGGANT